MGDEVQWSGEESGNERLRKSRGQVAVERRVD